MATLVDYMIGLYRSPEAAQAFIEAPAKALTDAGFPDVTADQLQALAASTAPPDVALGGGDVVAGLQRAVAHHHGINLDSGSGAETDAEAGDYGFGSRYGSGGEASSSTGPAGAEDPDDRFSVGYDPIDLNEAPGSTVPADADDAPADSLLLPYFEVDLDETSGSAVPTTIEEAKTHEATAQEAEGRFSVGYDAIDPDETPEPTAPEGADDAPADSLLLPYFEVDLNEPAATEGAFPTDGV